MAFWWTLEHATVANFKAGLIFSKYIPLGMCRLQMNTVHNIACWKSFDFKDQDYSSQMYEQKDQ